MKKIQELENYIKLKSEEHKNADDEFEYENSEITVYKEMMRFFLNEGFTLKGIDFNIFFNGIDFDDESNIDADEDMDSTYYFNKILETIEEMDGNNELPSYVKQLHDLWKKSFFY